MIELFKGDSKTIKVAITNNGEAMDLTGWEAALSVKASQSDEQPLLATTVANIDNPVDGIVVFELNPTQTNIRPGNYLYAIEIRKGADNTLEVHTVASGRFIVKWDVG